ncbi:DinB superfamily protein [Pustulibacterium marinum]|uniref:DinB superfamily protein n=1 Tax=Pustulibacterium marinum TaxID=1224947 RepID=A0A1I7G5S1_9FLAO|nr:putative metal-dependent hydrolase [Pustulibacterium marinum]SFU43810.1 DinB superfamily protein [Pustulibacterium marinum]
MTEAQLELLKYPIGTFVWANEEVSDEQLQEWIRQIEDLPAKLEKLIEHFTEEQFQTQYRPGGWTVQQVIHHLVDSHVNSYVRYKWALTEEKPIIKAYDEAKWAELPDYEVPPEVSIVMLKALHLKWTVLLKVMKPEEFNKSFIHPETGKEMDLRRVTGMYAWHGNHHYAHIEHLAKRNDWI